MKVIISGRVAFALMLAWLVVLAVVMTVGVSPLQAEASPTAMRRPVSLAIGCAVFAFGKVLFYGQLCWSTGWRTARAYTLWPDPRD